jgi:hypothetical protein
MLISELNCARLINYEFAISIYGINNTGVVGMEVCAIGTYGV